MLINRDEYIWERHRDTIYVSIRLERIGRYRIRGARSGLNENTSIQSYTRDHI